MTHTCTRHQPGSYSCYQRHGCHCPDCCTAATRYRKRAKLARDRGIPSRIPADQAKAHVSALLGAGMGRAEVARLADVSPVVITRLIRGDTIRITPTTDRRLRSVPHLPIESHETGMVSAVGSLRRIEALVKQGWTFQAITERGGLRRHIHSEIIRRGQVFAATRSAIVAVYADLWDQQPAETTGAVRSRLRAQREGWPPPLAWDDGMGPHGIDNPDATPHPWQRAERSTQSGTDLIELIDAGVSLGGLIERGWTETGIEAGLRRQHRTDLWAALRPRIQPTIVNQYTKEAA